MAANINESTRIIVSYHGVEKLIAYDYGQRYAVILKKVMDCFELPMELRKAIVLTNVDGKIFTPNIFDNYLILFPSPLSIFYMRLNHKQLCRKSIGSTQRISKDPFNTTKTPNNKRTLERDANNEAMNDDANVASTSSAAYAAPVRRMNCFIGVWPSAAEMRGEKEPESKPKRRRIEKSKNSARMLTKRSNKTLQKKVMRL